MNVYKIPENLETIIFDIDSTLYTCPSYAYEQVDCQVRAFSKMRGISAEEGREMVANYRKEYASQNNGKKVSLGNTLLSFGVPIEQSVRWREQLLEPKDFLHTDEKLKLVLKELKEKYKLICVTNNPVLPARKTLEAIGISDFFPDIVGLDTCYKSKPAFEPFWEACDITNTKCENCLSVGDRYDMDISLPLDLGMGGILVSGVEEVYNLVTII